MAISLKDIGSRLQSIFEKFNPFKEETFTIYGNKTGPGFDGPMLQPGTPGNPIKPPSTENYQHSIPVSYPGMNEAPQSIFYNDRNGEQQKFNLAQSLMENFDDIKQATPAASMLAHGHEQTYTPEEVQRLGRDNWNYGENPRFEVISDSKQTNGTWDKGLMRTNTGTFDDMLSKPVWRQKLAERGITKWEDLDDPELNVRAARTMLEYANWKNGQIEEKPQWNWWYNAPLDNRTGDY